MVTMPHKRLHKKRKGIGIEPIVEPGVGALYVRGVWMKKLDEMGKHKRKLIRRSRGKRK